MAGFFQKLGNTLQDAVHSAGNAITAGVAATLVFSSTGDASRAAEAYDVNIKTDDIVIRGLDQTSHVFGLGIGSSGVAREYSQMLNTFGATYQNIIDQQFKGNSQEFLNAIIQGDVSVPGIKVSDSKLGSVVTVTADVNLPGGRSAEMNLSFQKVIGDHENRVFPGEASLVAENGDHIKFDLVDDKIQVTSQKGKDLTPNKEYDANNVPKGDLSKKDIVATPAEPGPSNPLQEGLLDLLEMTEGEGPDGQLASGKASSADNNDVQTASARTERLDENLGVGTAFHDAQSVVSIMLDYNFAERIQGNGESPLDILRELRPEELEAEGIKIVRDDGGDSLALSVAVNGQEVLLSLDGNGNASPLSQMPEAASPQRTASLDGEAHEYSGGGTPSPVPL